MKKNERAQRRLAALSRTRTSTTRHPQYATEDDDDNSGLFVAMAGVGFLVIAITIGVIVYQFVWTGSGKIEIATSNPTEAQQPAIWDADEPDPNWGPRKKAQWSWLSPAIKLGNETGDERIQRLVRMLQERGVAATPRPRPEVIEFIDTPSVKNWIALVPVLPQDENLGDFWEAVTQAHGLQGYTHQFGDGDIIGLRNTVEKSSFNKACTLLHEASHVATKDDKEADTGTLEGYCRSERVARETENKVLLTVGGDRIRTMIQSFAERAVIPLLKRTQCQAGQLPKEAAPELEEAQEIFQIVKASSENDREDVLLIFWLSSVDFGISQVCSEVEDQEKDNFYIMFYRDNFRRSDR